jgi:hypothetical protein
MADEPQGVVQREPDPATIRREVQAALGQVHGALHLAVDRAESWLEPNEAGITADDLRGAYSEVAQNFGALHASLNTGQHDTNLAKAGLAGAQGSAKLKGLRARLARLFDVNGVKAAGAAFVSRLVPVLKWATPFVGSVGSALQKESALLPGAAIAAESLKEFMELLLNTAPSPAPPPASVGTDKRRPSANEPA